MTENQSRERHDGIFLLHSVTLFTPNWLDVPQLWFSNWRSRQVSGLNKDIYCKKNPKTLNVPENFGIIFAASRLPPGINHAAQPGRCNQNLCGWGKFTSPFAVGFLSATPTCHSHRVTSRSCAFLEEGVSHKRFSIYFGLEFKMLDSLQKDAHNI